MAEFLSADELRRCPLVLAAVSKGTVMADHTFEPGADISVGSNSGNELVIPEKFELTSYPLIASGHILKLVPPLHVQATVWHDGAPRVLKGFFRELRKQDPGLPDSFALATTTFVVSYASGIAFMGRFVVTQH